MTKHVIKSVASPKFEKDRMDGQKSRQYVAIRVEEVLSTFSNKRTPSADTIVYFQKYDAQGEPFWACPTGDPMKHFRVGQPLPENGEFVQFRSDKGEIVPYQIPNSQYYASTRTFFVPAGVDPKVWARQKGHPVAEEQEVKDAIIELFNEMQEQGLVREFTPTTQRTASSALADLRQELGLDEPAEKPAPKPLAKKALRNQPVK